MSRHAAASARASGETPLRAKAQTARLASAGRTARCRAAGPWMPKAIAMQEALKSQDSTDDEGPLELGLSQGNRRQSRQSTKRKGDAPAVPVHFARLKGTAPFTGLLRQWGPSRGSRFGQPRGGSRTTPGLR